MRRQALPEGDARIVSDETKLDAQKRALAGNRRPELVECQARATHVVPGDIAFVDDGDAIQGEHADRRAERRTVGRRRPAPTPEGERHAALGDALQDVAAEEHPLALGSIHHTTRYAHVLPALSEERVSNRDVVAAVGD